MSQMVTDVTESYRLETGLNGRLQLGRNLSCFMGEPQTRGPGVRHASQIMNN